MPYYKPGEQTTDATPKEVYLSIGTSPDSLSRLPVYVFASDHAGNVAYWSGALVIRVLLNGALAFVGSLTKTSSPGAAAWTASIVVGADGNLYTRITGAAGVTVDWLITNDDIFSMVGAY
jgi:hypothetical protein